MGLSIGVEEARKLLDAEYRGPIVRGDLDAIGTYQHVIIIDGMMEADQRIPLQEVVTALERGVVIHGASSMGALLSVELEQVRNITGYGQVFETLRLLKQHDEALPLEDLIVALYTRDELEPLTVPLIEPISYLLDQGCGGDEMVRIASALCEIPVENRSWCSIRCRAVELGLALPDGGDVTGIKRRDAREFLMNFGFSAT